MAKSIEFFSWLRLDGGYEWRTSSVLAPDNQTGLTDSEKHETRFLMPRTSEIARYSRYDPLAEYPTLYRDFAALDPTEEAYAKFASTYGDLGVGVMVMEDGPVAAWDPFCRWRTAHSNVRPVVDVLNAIEAEDSAALSKWFIRAPTGFRYEREDPTFGSALGWVTIQDELRPYVWRWVTEAPSNTEALLRIARAWVQDRINDALGGTRQVGTKASARVVFDSDREKMTIRVVPETLIGAIWFQCARVLALNPTFRSCAHCGKWFELSPDTRRRQSIYCSNRCKVAAYRAKKGGHK